MKYIMLTNTRDRNKRNKGRKEEQNKIKEPRQKE